MAANTYGRQVVIALTNKSGSQVIAGDVVILDSTNNDAFTTTTSVGVTTPVGVAQETIANNGTGRVLVGGYAALVNVDASVTRGHYGKTQNVAKQATDAGSSRVAGTFCWFMTGGTTPDAWIYPVDLAGAALTNPMTTTSDMIYSSDNSGTPARLAKGSAGATLAMGNGALLWNAGTSFPSSKATNDRYFRTDILGGTEFKWDGTQWRSTQVLVLPLFGITNQTTSQSATFATAGGVPILKGTYTLYLLSCEVYELLANSTSDATHYWSVQFNYLDAAGNRNAVGSAFDTKSDTANQISYHSISLNTVLNTGAFGMDLLWTKSNGPNITQSSAYVLANLIAT